MTIQREALKAKRPTVDWADKSDVYVQAAFDAALEDSGTQQPAPDQLSQFAKDAANPVTDNEPKPNAYQQFKQSQADAWKGA